MSTPGWYPDPAGAAGRFRYWDGRTWSAATTTRPSDPPPSPPAGGDGRRRRTPLLIGAVIVVLALIVVGGVFVVRALNKPDVITDYGPSPTVSGWDDSSPTPTPPETSSPTPSAAETPPAPLTVCPTGNPDARQAHPADGRIHGGGLSFAARSDWSQSTLKRGLSWAYDVDGQDKAIEPSWYAMFAVGALFTADGFEQPQQAAEGVMQCTATSDFYDGFTGRRDLFSQQVSVDGHPGWALRSEIHVTSQLTKLPGDVVEVVVVDLGSPESLAMFWGAVPIGDAGLSTLMDGEISGLRVG